MSGYKFDWDTNREQDLLERRGFSFPEVVAAILGERLMAVLEHSDQARYPGQKYYQVEIESNDQKYTCLVPFSRLENCTIRLYTIATSRPPI